MRHKANKLNAQASAQAHIEALQSDAPGAANLLETSHVVEGDNSDYLSTALSYLQPLEAAKTFLKNRHLLRRSFLICLRQSNIE